MMTADHLEKCNNQLRQECYKLEAEKRYLVRSLMERSNMDNTNMTTDTMAPDMTTVTN